MNEAKFIELLRRLDNDMNTFNFGVSSFQVLQEYKETRRDMQFIHGCLYALLDLYETKCVNTKFTNEYEEVMDAKTWLLNFIYDSHEGL